MHDLLTQGIHENISEERYHADPVIEPSLSRSVIKELVTKTPAHVKYGHPRLNPCHQPEESKAAFDLGTAAHALLLQGEDKAEILDYPDWRSGKAKAERDEARRLGKIPFLKHQWDEVLAMVAAARKQIAESVDLQGVNLLTDGNAEQTLVWKEISGIWCRVRPDWWSNDREIMVDYKTTGKSADPDDFIKNVISMGYDIQDQFYSRGANRLTGKLPKFVFVAQETEAPYLCSFICLDPEFKQMGFEKMERGMDIWERCMKSNKWPGYPKRACHISPPSWALAQWAMKMEEA